MTVLYRSPGGVFQPRDGAGRYATRTGTRTVTVLSPAATHTRIEPQGGPQVLSSSAVAAKTEKVDSK
ncbi:MAG: hypothetical protein KM310_10480 [Clostridiales bacterium]|nr:hypothetical protein [Clostridiales bacterium]